MAPSGRGSRAPAGVAHRARSANRRVARAWRSSGADQRLGAVAALGLFASMFLPWYTKTVYFVGIGSRPELRSISLSAFGAFSFVEAAVLLVASAVLALLFARAERRAFHLPGGDGAIITAAGLWAAALIFYRLLDKPTLKGNDTVAASEGVQWGIFVALLLALALAWAGGRVRAARRSEPPLSGGRRRERPAAATRSSRPDRSDRSGPPTDESSGASGDDTRLSTATVEEQPGSGSLSSHRPRRRP